MAVYTNDQIANYLIYESGQPATKWAVSNISYNLDGVAPNARHLVTTALETWSSVTGLYFYQASVSPLITFDDNYAGAYASYSYFSSPGGGDRTFHRANVNVSKDWIADFGTGYDSYSFQTYLHEIGHAIGLNHAGDYNGNATYGVHNHYDNDSWQATVMSYFHQQENTSVNASFAFVLTPMIADILAVWSLYGAPNNIRTGDTKYGYGSNAGGVYDQITNFGDRVTFTIVDDGGVDTIDFYYDRSNQRVNLNGETYSDVFGLTGNMAIMRGTVIENYIAGQGHDTVYGNDQNNYMRGSGGNDRLFGETGNDALHGGDGNDLVVGGSGNDALFGDAGADTLVGNDGADFLRGWTGTDTLWGDSGDDSLHGGQGRDVLQGGSGNDALFGDEGADVLVGGIGNDFLRGWTGADELWGESGDDTLHGGQENDVLVGGGGNDALFGDHGDDTVVGSDGNDWLTGWEGSDKLWGGNDSDTLLGETGNDFLLGEAGNDTLIGGLGDDELTGGGDEDTFIFRSNHGNDRIRDFSSDADIIRLEGIAKSFAELQITSSQNGALIDTGSGTIQLDGVSALSLTADDFQFI